MSRSSTRLTFVVTAAMLAAVVAWHPAEQLETARRAIGLGQERPLPAPAVVRAGGTYAWAMTQPDSDAPVGWDPCEEIRYRVNPAGEPPGGRTLVTEALRRASAATGLSFADEGDTDDRPFRDGLELFGRPEPIVIGWGDQGEYPDLGGQVAGVGGAVAERDPAGRLRFVSGRGSSTSRRSPPPPLPSSPGSWRRSCCTRSRTWSGSATSASRWS